MNNYDLSVLIPARNEEFICETVESCLSAIRGNTEIIVWLDGDWPLGRGIPDDPRVTVVYSSTSIGQRGATNQACRLSKAKYVFKADAHCAFDEGFDVKMMAEMHDDWTMIPKMFNLHAFNWQCKKCGNETYQGQVPKECPNCDNMEQFEKVMVWKPRLNKESETYRFDVTLHFQYHGDRKHWGNNDNEDIIETMSTQGSGFMLTREKYWELKISDEAMAGKNGWGQQGVEVACKTWLSGGRLVVNKKTWYSHMFRTQGGTFGFPYPFEPGEQEMAREISRDLWLNNKWEGQKLPLSWLIEKFKPLADWHDPSNKEVLDRVNKAGDEFMIKQNPRFYADGTKVPNVTRGIIFYTDNRLNRRIAHAVQRQLDKISQDYQIPIISSSLKNMSHFGKNIQLPLKRGVETYFLQIILALQTLDTDVVFFCEHDVLYHSSHFDFTPEKEDKFYYNQNFWRIRKDGFAVHWDANQVSGLVCYRQLALDWYKKKLAEAFNRSYEPGGRDSNQYEVFKSKYPNVDIRHDGTLTKSKWSPDDFRDKSTCVNWQESTIDNIPGWDSKQLHKLF